MWHKKSMLRKSFLILVGAFLFVPIFSLETANTTIAEPTILNGTPKAVSPCLTDHCVRIASNILEAMDTSVDPCEDFYSYACNGWIKANPIPEGKSGWSTFMKAEQENQLAIKYVLERPIENLKSKAEIKAKLYYESCLDVNDTIEVLGATPMLELINKIGGWIVTDSSFNIFTWNLQKVLQILQNRFNIGALFSYTVGEDDRNSSRHIIQIDQSGLTLPTRENYLDKKEHAKILAAYLEYMTKVGVLLNGEPNATQAHMQDVIDFETRLAYITTPNDQQELFYHAMSIAQLQKLATFIDWQEFFEDAFRIIDKKVTQNENVTVYAAEYLEKLDDLIREYEETPRGRMILNNYLIWQTVKTFSSSLSKEFRDAYKVLRKALLGSQGGEEPLWRYCIADTNNALGYATGAIFVKEVFQSESKVQVESIVNRVRETFKSNFKNLNWMDIETRMAAESKADAVFDMIGYPEFILHSDQLNERYSMLQIRRDTYFENNINLKHYVLRKNLEKINEPVNKRLWNMFPQTTNAYYTPNKNQIVFPAGILQKPFYNAKYPPSLNYGAVGVLIAHELTHGFDDLGREFDKDGNLKNWWTGKTTEQFQNKTKCFVDQYNKYEVNGKNVNGKQTLGENIADVGGLKTAYYAYLDIANKQPEQPPLPGLNLTHRQLFFVASAQVWCSSVSNELTNLQIEKDLHSPASIRALGSLSNLKEFSEEFNCKPESKMNLNERCEVW